MARYHLRLSSNDFYALTPRQFYLLVERHRERSEYENFLVGLVASTVANYSLGAPQTPLRPQDFMPTRSAPKPERINRKGVATNIRCFLLARTGIEHS